MTTTTTTTTTSPAAARVPRPRAWLPIAIFIALVVLLAVGLTLNPREVPSPLVGKPAPDFQLPLLGDPQRSFSPRDMTGKVWLFNVWASWCVTCREEHPVLSEFAKSGLVPVIGLDYKDKRDEAFQYLTKLGNPYQLSAYDPQGRVGIDYGVYGTPETYVIDKQGVIRYKRIGPLTPEIIRTKIIPLVHELNR
jgi:cytochrome c biogenesis protein CcmG/thiol:disulfide interchange protein DsbE